MGFTKLVNEIDMKEAARLGLHSKPLTKRGIEKHLEDVGIEPEVGSHTRMRGLSGGQKVKVVLAAAMWLNPHMVSVSPRNCQQFGGLPFPQEIVSSLVGCPFPCSSPVLPSRTGLCFAILLYFSTWDTAYPVLPINSLSC
jgi:hypothetical protein